jgi:hypothetical protein
VCEVVKKYAYNALMGGSNGIKVVLVACLERSDVLKSNDGRSIVEAGVSSLNFDDGRTWLACEGGTIVSSYMVLPLLFEAWTGEQLETTVSELVAVNNGGAALTARGKL